MRSDHQRNALRSNHHKPTITARHISTRTTLRARAKSDEALTDEQLIYSELKQVLRRSRFARQEVDELTARAWLGIYEARRLFNPEAGANFFTYARRRVRGAIYDGLADLMTPLGRRGFRFIKRNEEEQSPKDITNKSTDNLSVRSFAQLAYLNGDETTSYAHPQGPLREGSRDPLKLSQDQERWSLMREVVSIAFRDLSESEQAIMIAVYDLREIGDNAYACARRLQVHRSTILRRQSVIIRKLRRSVRRLLNERSISWEVNSEFEPELETLRHERSHGATGED